MGRKSLKALFWCFVCLEKLVEEFTRLPSSEEIRFRVDGEA